MDFIPAAAFLLIIACAGADYLVDDRSANAHIFLHKAVYFFETIWCIYWSTSLASRIVDSTQVFREITVSLGEIAVVVIPLLVLQTKVWTKQGSNAKRYTAGAQSMSVENDEESRLRKQATALANMLGLNESGVPNLLNDYGGYIQELQMQFQASIRFRTNKRMLALMEQVKNGYELVRQLHLAQDALAKIQAEKATNNLEIQKRQIGLQLDIERLKKELKEVNDPPPQVPKSNPRRISPFAKDE